LQIVDSHVHPSLAWFEPVESLLFHMDRYGVEKALLVQIYNQFNNDYLFECQRRYPDRFVSVTVVIDTDAPDAPETLERLVDQGASGLKLRVDARSPGKDPLAIYRTAERLGIAVSVGGFQKMFLSDDFAHLIQAVPKLPIVMEHLGADGGGRDPLDVTAFAKVFELARFPNLYVRFHGLAEFAPRAIPVTEPFPFKLPVPPLLEMAYDAFGPERMMWGSDYPPVSIREGYGLSLRLPLEQLAGKSDADKALMFGKVAATVFPAR
jgi:L-fuconolactonase